MTFNADSAYQYCAAQCAFGPRTMNSEAHDRCASWLKATFESFGCTVESRKADLKGYDGTVLKAENIIARLNPSATRRVLLCAHWDSRPWADNDADPANHKLEVMGANDGASGVAVMLELARTLNAAMADTAITARLPRPLSDLGVDFVCFDAEDWGVPQWADVADSEATWALGAQRWAAEYDKNKDGEYLFGILLDMVGGEGARFHEEYFSVRYAPALVSQVWDAAGRIGYGTYFPQAEGGAITDDHLPVNREAHIQCIDIIPYYKDCPQSSFGPTWHTVNDTMDNISRATLNAVGQTLAYFLTEY